jgi:hypothetical protein
MGRLMNRRNHGLKGFGRHEYTGHPGTWMGAGTHHEEVFYVFTAVVRSKPGTLQEQGFQTKCRTLEGEQSVMKVLRCH